MHGAMNPSGDRQAVLALRDYLPAYCHRVTHLGCGRGDFAECYADRDDIDVHGIDWMPVSHPSPALASFAVIQRGAFPCPPADAVVWSRVTECGDGFADMLASCDAALPPDGCLLIANFPEAWSNALADQGFIPYRSWDLDGTSLLLVVRTGYDPIAHARALSRAGDLSGALCALDLIPPSMQSDPEAQARIAFEKQLAICSLQVQGEPDLALRVLHEGQTWFYEVVARTPDFLPAYAAQAELWLRTGSSDMARRLLRSIHHADPTELSAQRLERFASIETNTTVPVVTPPPSAPDRPLRILFLTHTRPDYGLDTLYDGLCACLGDDAVTEYPWKPSLHDPLRATDTRYPCVFNRAGTPADADAIIEQITAGAFDVLLFGMIDPDVDPSTIQRIVAAARHLPFFVIDQQDNPHNNLPAALAYCGAPEALAYFKREKLAVGIYRPQTIPLPFSHAAIANPAATPRTTPLFWAGHRLLGLRRLYLEHIERRFNLDLDRHLPPDTYARALDNARAGLAFFGGGYDTVRYWELPAHGALLIGERLPIHIPNDFTDGENALLFGDLPELEDRVSFVLADPASAAAIAQRGSDHFHQYHTHTARARDLLAHIARFLDSPPTAPL